MELIWQLPDSTEAVGWSVFRGATDDFAQAQALDVQGSIASAGLERMATAQIRVIDPDPLPGRAWYWLVAVNGTGEAVAIQIATVQVDPAPPMDGEYRVMLTALQR